ncbi:uncharacterized protein ASPGLDRAFT_411659 [Aspergillus glaucus CBS 516.65]|uniref:Uncharacterized protein n=1 Tax=Aspergillus glaucus CBS 516.65 TaxID=1160497 RepID=A0A1L9VI14_ASPGL|nr:hypothetical protein ASPGLDRAFT_411659 [Aspergillus glaucus CBS 516.65]OJJ83559.1 hypothetical protein ASPGLDRAFT_411659 [Aspergillus glaucus CBS 516.65]
MPCWVCVVSWGIHSLIRHIIRRLTSLLSVDACSLMMIHTLCLLSSYAVPRVSLPATSSTDINFPGALFRILRTLGILRNNTIQLVRLIFFVLVLQCLLLRNPEFAHSFLMSGSAL